MPFCQKATGSAASALCVEHKLMKQDCGLWSHMSALIQSERAAGSHYVKVVRAFGAPAWYRPEKQQAVWDLPRSAPGLKPVPSKASPSRPRPLQLTHGRSLLPSCCTSHCSFITSSRRSRIQRFVTRETAADFIWLWTGVSAMSKHQSYCKEMLFVTEMYTFVANTA